MTISATQNKKAAVFKEHEEVMFLIDFIWLTIAFRRLWYFVRQCIARRRLL